MRNRLMVLVAALVMAAAAQPATAGATNQAFKYWESSKSSTDWQGTRSSIGNTISSERSVSSGDWMLTSVFAVDLAGDGIQQGVTYEFNDPEGPSCNLGDYGYPYLYYFTEKVVSGNYSCYSGGTIAQNGTAHVQKVQKDGSGYWRAYLDGTYQSVQTHWSACGGNACGIYAFGEEDASKSGLWYAKFAGSGNTKWQFWNGTIWSTINSAGTKSPLDPGWSGPTGPFPGGIWSFKYSK